MCFRYSAYGTPWKQGWKKPGFFQKTQPSVYMGFLVFFSYICPEERVFRVFIPVSRILLGASRL
jgi:hypothetical protein